jgi:hypothetical protein
MSHDDSLLSKVGSATIAALGRAVNTLLTPTTMGAKKFNIIVTIDNEKALEIGHFLHCCIKARIARMPIRYPRSISLSLTASVWPSDTAATQSRFKSQPDSEYSCLVDYFRNILAAIFLSRSAIKDATNVGFNPPAYVSDAPRGVDCGFDSFEGSDPGCGYI